MKSRHLHTDVFYALDENFCARMTHKSNSKFSSRLNVNTIVKL